MGCNDSGQNVSHSARGTATKKRGKKLAGAGVLDRCGPHGRKKDGTKGASFRLLCPFALALHQYQAQNCAQAIAPRLERGDRGAKGGRRGFSNRSTISSLLSVSCSLQRESLRAKRRKESRRRLAPAVRLQRRHLFRAPRQR